MDISFRRFKFKFNRRYAVINNFCYADWAFRHQVTWDITTVKRPGCTFSLGIPNYTTIPFTQNQDMFFDFQFINCVLYGKSYKNKHFSYQNGLKSAILTTFFLVVCNVIQLPLSLKIHFLRNQAVAQLARIAKLNNSLTTSLFW